MNSVQVHLALTHVPVILSLVGLILLIVALILKNITLIKAAYMIIIIAGIAVLPVFLSGEGTEEAVEKLPGVSDAIIERHEEVAKLAMISMVAAGVFATAAMFSFQWSFATRVLRIVILFLALSAGGLMAQTAHSGGQIRHTEIRGGSTSLNAQGTNDRSTPTKEQDDD